MSAAAGAGCVVGSSVGSVGSCAGRYDTAITCLFIFWCHYHTHLHHNTQTFVTDITYPTHLHNLLTHTFSSINDFVSLVNYLMDEFFLS